MIQNRLKIFDLLATLSKYPDEDYAAVLNACIEQLTSDGSNSSPLLAGYAKQIGGLSVERLQEIYTSTFDLDPACALEVGWHLYGESYQRGEFLVEMRKILRRLGIHEGGELPDHLTSLLMALGRMDDGQADQLARLYVIPSVEKIVFALRSKGSQCEDLMKAILAVLNEWHPLPHTEVQHA